MQIKDYLVWAVSCILTSSAVAQSDGPVEGLGYRTHGYELGQGNTHFGPSTDYGHAHFTKPRYGNSAYYRSYHAHKDIIKENGGDVYAPPWYLDPYYQNGYSYPPYRAGYNYPPNAYSDHSSSGGSHSPNTIQRRLERSLDGRCYEIKRDGSTELRIELPASECAIVSDPEQK